MRDQALLLALGGMLALAGPQSPINLRCEYMTDPMGVDIRNPRLYWTPRHSERAATQSAYQIVVSSKQDAATGDIWDTGKVASPEFIHIAYAGRPLQSGTTYYWKVRYWDQNGNPSEYSRVARFETGLFDPGEWKAKWIRGGNQVRKEFNLPTAPRRARAYVSGAGYYELRINGHKIGDHVLDPAYTTYNRRVLYATYDITRDLKQGVNAAGLMLGRGWYDGYAGILQIDVEMENGAKAVIATDGSWKGTKGPIVEDSIYDGETYDARRETPGWDSPGYDDSRWEAVSLDNVPKGVLSAQVMPPIRVVADIPAIKTWSPKPGTYVYDLGQNLSGWTRLRVTGPAGTAVRIRHSELIYPDGTINVENLRSARATDTYVLKGTGEEETYEPRFTYHGFRYIEITGYPGTPPPGAILAREVHTDVRPTGGFSASKPVLNQIQRALTWGIKSNLHSIPTDCNQRDERMGWMADAHLYSEAAMMNFDVAAFYTNFRRDIRDSQESDGSVPDTVPRARFAEGPADPSWGAAFPLIAWYMYERYGDRRALEENFDGMRRWADFLGSRSKDGLVDYAKYGDWVPVEPTSRLLAAAVYQYLSTETVARAASVLGKTADAQKYDGMAKGIAAAFHRKYYNADTGLYGPTQSANLLPLAAGMAPEDARDRLGSFVRDDVVYTHNTHLTTGILGTKYLLPFFAQSEADLAYDLATQTTYPSWGYMMDRGATTLWELWQERTGPSMNSHNHPMFGSIGTYFYEYLAGIQRDGNSTGYERIRIAPGVVRDLDYASGSIETVRGPVLSAWTRHGDALVLRVSIPVGSTAQVQLPSGNLRDVSITEGGSPVWAQGKYVPGVPGISSAKASENAVVIVTGSGDYTFERQGN